MAVSFSGRVWSPALIGPEIAAAVEPDHRHVSVQPAGILGSVRAPIALSLTLLLACTLPARAAGDKAADAVRPRVEHHLSRAEQITQHFETIIAEACPHFATRAEWQTYFDGTVDRVVSLVAHLEQAWVEAKQTGDKDVRREAKAPRRRVDRAEALLAKLQTCANGEGAGFTAGAVWRQIEREVPRRQSEIALPKAPLPR